ncbi:helix-turn-helix domain-containing protein [Cellulomonas massiliensis]|uniref:helix-turn-helix domain-containing protein n=1 Tax=Cellulomonas massiliensis TaxID=1465811 RepID=UPI000304767F|nr:helix-turn-helix transcriptional regulator [Cellulomonas massiliensis]
MSPLSRRIREARERAGLSQSGLARAADVHQSYISHVERGTRALGPDALERVARALGVSVEYLHEGVDAPGYKQAEQALAEGRRLMRQDRAADAVAVLASVELARVDVDEATKVRLAHAEALDLAGRLEDSVEVLQDVVEQLCAAGRYARAAYASMRAVMALTEAADLQRAIEKGEEDLERLREHAEGSDEVVRLESTLLWAYIARGDTTYARFRGNQLLERTREVGSARAVSSVHWNLAFIDDALGRSDDALHQLEAAIALAGADEVDRDLPRLRLDRALLLVTVDPPRPAEALAELDAAQAALEIGESEVELARAASVRSRAHLLLGDAREALRYASEAVEMLRGGVRRDAAAAHEALGDALLALDARTEAVKEFRSAAELLDMISSGRSAATVWRRIGDRLRIAGDEDARVVEAYSRALSAAGIRTTLPVPPR